MLTIDLGPIARVKDRVRLFFDFSQKTYNMIS